MNGRTPVAATSTPPGLHGRCVAQNIRIDAPAEVVWELLDDVDGWSRWNPLYVRASGSTRLGATIDLAIVLPGMKPQNTQATVAARTPNVELQYRTKGFGGLLRGTRYVAIEPASGQGCVVSNGEVMTGPLSRIVVGVLGPRIRHGLTLMNEALKTTAEARWRAGAG